MHIAHSGRGDESDEVAPDPVLCPGDQAGRAELLHQRRQVQRTEVTFAPVARVIGEDLLDVGDPGGSRGIAAVAAEALWINSLTVI